MNESELAAWARNELTGNILPFWIRHGRDVNTGGFYGNLDNDNKGDPAESRSVVMTSRHLWAYSAASRMPGDAGTPADPRWMEMAAYAYRALTRDFLDPVYGGVYWSVKPDGQADVARKQIYGEAFAMYAFSEYALAGGPVASLETALMIYSLLESKARDLAYGGYVEARSRDWQPTRELKLSDKDIDCEKSMNTNLHVMEALTALHRAWRALHPGSTDVLSRIAESLSSLVSVTVDKILGADAHLDLYFDADWKPIGDIISYGHDIEASWLLWEAADELGDGALAEKIRPAVIRIAETALAEGFDAATGGMENEFHGGRKDRTRVWWCQAEALVGFWNAWQMTGDEKFRVAAYKSASWIDTFQIDRANGDWFWAVDPQGKPDLSQSKGGNWKTAYHNARCCMELLHRIGEK